MSAKWSSRTFSIMSTILVSNFKHYMLKPTKFSSSLMSQDSYCRKSHLWSEMSPRSITILESAVVNVLVVQAVNFEAYSGGNKKLFILTLLAIT